MLGGAAAADATRSNRASVLMGAACSWAPFSSHTPQPSVGFSVVGKGSPWLALRPAAPRRHRRGPSSHRNPTLHGAAHTQAD